MLYKRYTLVTVSEVKWPPGSRSGLKYPLELLESSIYNCFSRRGRWGMGVVTEICVNTVPGGSKMDLTCWYCTVLYCTIFSTVELYGVVLL